MSAKRTRLKALRLDSISLVDRGDNPLAHVAILKRRSDVPEPTPVRKDAPPTCGELLQQREASDDLHKLHWAFQDSMSAILWSGADNKVELLTKSVDEFGALLEEIVGPVQVAMKAAPDESPEAFAKRAVEAMDAVVKKARKSMPAPKIDPKAEVAKVDLSAIPEPQRPAVEALAKRADDAAAEVAKATAERDAQKARADAAEAELQKVAPNPYHGMPEAAANELRKRDAENADLRKRLDEADAVAKARADGFGDLPGTRVEKIAPLLLRVSKGRSNAEDAEELERLLKSLQALAQRGLGTIGTAGTTGPADGTAAAEVEKRAHERVAKGTSASLGLARMDVLTADAALSNRYYQERDGQPAAA